MIVLLLNFDVEYKRIKFNGDYIDIYKPKAEGNYPFVIFSGGMNSPSSRYESFGKFLASNGFITIIPDYKGWLFLLLIPLKILRIIDNLNKIDSSIKMKAVLGDIHLVLIFL